MGQKYLNLSAVAQLLPNKRIMKKRHIFDLMSMSNKAKYFAKVRNACRTVLYYAKVF